MFRKFSVNISPFFSSISKKYCKYNFNKTGIPPKGSNLPFIGLMSTLGSKEPFLASDAPLLCHLFLK